MFLVFEENSTAFSALESIYIIAFFRVVVASNGMYCTYFSQLNSSTKSLM